MRKLYGVWDVKGCEYLGPLFVFANDAIAGRSISDACGDGTVLRAHPEDYQLVCVADVGEDGTVKSLEVPRLVVRVVDLIAPPGAVADSPRQEQGVLSLAKEA